MSHDFAIELAFEFEAHAARRAQIELDRTLSRERLFTLLNEEYATYAGLHPFSPVVLEFLLWGGEMLALHDDFWHAQLAQEKELHSSKIQTLLQYVFRSICDWN